MMMHNHYASEEAYVRRVASPLLLPEGIRDMSPPPFYKRRHFCISRKDCKYKIPNTKVLDQSYENLDKIGKGTFGQVF